MNNLPDIESSPKTGREKLSFKDKELPYSVYDFWRWSVSDLLSNATRGRFAEFVVGTAIGLNLDKIRSEWDAFDLTTDEGIKIEIKSASYIQSWFQRDYSKIQFSIKPSRYWDAGNNKQDSLLKRHADVYVFCLIKHKEQETIDVLKIEQWEFYVLATNKLNKYERSQTSITLKSLKKLTDSVDYNKLNETIKNAYADQKAEA